MQKYFLVMTAWVLILTGAISSEAPWSGKWHVFWQEGALILQLQQHGNEVNGTYQPNDGILKGTAEGRIFKGVSINRQNTDRFIFTLSADGDAFFGNMQSGDWVAGSRVKEQGGQKKYPLGTIQTPLRRCTVF